MMTMMVVVVVRALGCCRGLTPSVICRLTGRDVKLVFRRLSGYSASLSRTDNPSADDDDTRAYPSLVTACSDGTLRKLDTKEKVSEVSSSP